MQPWKQMLDAMAQRKKIPEVASGDCALCGLAAQVVDHDHQSGKRRGNLCAGCNRRLAPLERDRSYVLIGGSHDQREAWMQWRDRALVYLT